MTKANEIAINREKVRNKKRKKRAVKKITK